MSAGWAVTAAVAAGVVVLMRLPRELDPATPAVHTGMKLPAMLGLVALLAVGIAGVGFVGRRFKPPQPPESPGWLP